MENTLYLAHIAEDGREQTVREHLLGTAELCSVFAAPFGAEKLGTLAGLAHDIGKFSAAFQRRLRGDATKVDHASAGAFECLRLGQLHAALAVCGHHGGLVNGGGPGDTLERGTFFGRMTRARQGRLEPYDAWSEEVQLPPAPVPAIAQDDFFGNMFLARMLYSCLVDADYLDTEAFMAGTPPARGGGETTAQLEEKLRRHTAKWFPPKGELNRQRCAILSRCMEQGEAQSPGLFTLTVPTGGGKTVASLAFALAHAKRHSLRRVVYVIPYTSIIEQTAQTFRDILGDENVLEHHSAAAHVDQPADSESTPPSMRLARATENWDAPVIVTTAVQFFESLYANRPSQCRKLHNLAGSVIIFDEAQMLPLPYLRPCVAAIAQLVGRYRATAVLCTATQPALDKLFHEFLPGPPAVELCPPGLYQEQIFRRVTFQKEGRLTRAELASRMNALPQCLCIVNSRKSAQEIFRLLERQGSFHLSTLMCPAHRKKQLEEIRRRLLGGLACRVVSTSLIEAGVDVDFPAVFREEAGLDSILQAAGRCNREGRRPASDATVVIFQGENPPPPLFATAIGAGRQALARHEDTASRDAIRFYFQELLDLSGPAAQDQREILKIMRENPFCFQDVAERFRLIDSPTRTVYIPVGDGAGLTARLKSGERNRALLRRLGQFGVSIYEDHFKALYSANDLTLLEDETAVLENLALYSEEIGLSLDADSGKALFV